MDKRLAFIITQERSVMKKIISLLAFLPTLLFTQPVFAEAIGLPYARSSNVETHEYLTVEAGVQWGWYDNYVARATMRVGDQLSVYGDLGIYSLSWGHGYGSETGFSFGAGGFYSLGQLVEDIDFGVLTSFHYGTTDHFSTSDLAFRGQASTEIPTANALVTVYGSVGLEFLNREYDNCSFSSYCDFTYTEFVLGGGAAYPIGPGEAFASFELVDGATLGFGYRMGF